MMGKVAAELASHAIVTSDNPRSESPDTIVAEILEGMDGSGVAIVDRAEAISHAVKNAKPDDVVLIAGKGHENYQVIGERVLPFSDLETALASLRSRGGVPQ